MQSQPSRSLALELALALAALLASTSACSSSGATNGAGPSSTSADAGVDAPTTLEDTPDSSPPSKCAAPPSASKCKNEGAWVRGIAHFDPKHFAAGVKPVLRVTLRHEFALVKGEENIGGRLHGYKSIVVKDPSTGEVPFAIDMCGLGTAMWSEENGAFNVILHLDEDDNNDLSTARTNEDAVTIATPDKGELVKKVSVDVSCHAASPCLDVTLDCAAGTDCTKIEPITTCSARTPGCNSDDAFCN